MKRDLIKNNQYKIAPPKRGYASVLYFLAGVIPEQKPSRGEIAMPIIQVNLLEGRTVEQKRKYVADVTRVTCEDLGVPPDSVRIQFITMGHEDFAVAGVLHSDKK
jgi:4-oxalocrotonate tautomerase